MFNISIITKYFTKSKKYSIKKRNIYSNISKPPKIIYNQNEKYLFDKKFNEYINTFITIMSKNPNINLKLFYENLKTLIIKEKKNLNNIFLIKISGRGFYDLDENKILIQRDDNFFTIYHELLHCASRKVTNTQINTGFYKFIIDKKTKKITFKIGKALTEGYTTLLEKRYFDCIEHTQKYGYSVETFIAEIVEKIVGKDEMEKLYFNADFDGLIQNLKQFSNEEDIYCFLKYFDKILITSNNRVSSKGKKHIYKSMAYFLLKSYICKLIALLQKDKITREDFENLFDEFVENLSVHYVNNKKNTYYFLTEEFTNQILDEINEDLTNKQKIRLCN